MTSLTIYTDADNTLWDTDSVYRTAQLALLEQAEQISGREATPTDRLAFVRHYDQSIATRHHQQLRYPPALLIHALILGIHGTPAADAAEHVIQAGELPNTTQATRRFTEMLSASPPLLRGVRAGIELAVERGAILYVVTEGSRDRAERLLKEHSLTDKFTQVLSATKTEPLYKRLKTLAGTTPAAMIGDQLDRDVVLAHSAGLIAVWLPSAFHPKWVDATDSTAANFVASDFHVAIAWLLDVVTTDSISLSRPFFRART